MKKYHTAVYDNDRWQGFKSRPDDIFVCTPAKCGTTWTQTIVANLLFPDANFPAPVMQMKSIATKHESKARSRLRL